MGRRSQDSAKLKSFQTCTIFQRISAGKRCDRQGCGSGAASEAVRGERGRMMPQHLPTGSAQRRGICGVRKRDSGGAERCPGALFVHAVARDACGLCVSSCSPRLGI